MDYKRLGERIRKERLKRNLTQAQLAEAVDISDTYMVTVCGFEPCVTLCADSSELVVCFRFCVSLSLSTLPHSCSLSQKLTLKKFFF